MVQVLSFQRIIGMVNLRIEVKRTEMDIRMEI